MTDAHPSPGAVDGRYDEVATPRSLAERLTIHARDRIYDDFRASAGPGRRRRSWTWASPT